jgi:hypothetical protein
LNDDSFTSAPQLKRDPLGSPNEAFGMQRILILAAAAGLGMACHRPTEISGVYVSHDGSGSLFPCDDSRRVVAVRDAALADRYHSVATRNEPVFVRLFGIKGHAGSPKGSPKYYFLVHEILEIRMRADSDCPGIAQPLPRLLSGS